MFFIYFVVIFIIIATVSAIIIKLNIKSSDVVESLSPDTCNSNFPIINFDNIKNPIISLETNAIYSGVDNNFIRTNTDIMSENDKLKHNNIPNIIGGNIFPVSKYTKHDKYTPLFNNNNILQNYS